MRTNFRSFLLSLLALERFAIKVIDRSATFSYWKINHIIKSVKTSLPKSGTASDVAGIVSATIFRNTVRDRRMVTPAKEVRWLRLIIVKVECVEEVARWDQPSVLERSKGLQHVTTHAEGSSILNLHPKAIFPTLPYRTQWRKSTFLHFFYTLRENNIKKKKIIKENIFLNTNDVIWLISSFD